MPHQGRSGPLGLLDPPCRRELSPCQGCRLGSNLDSNPDTSLVTSQGLHRDTLSHSRGIHNRSLDILNHSRVMLSHNQDMLLYNNQFLRLSQVVG